MLTMKFQKIAPLFLGLIATEFTSRIILKGNLEPKLLLGYSIGALCIAIYLEWMIPKLSYNTSSLLLTLWINLFIIGGFINMIEGFYFTTVYNGLQGFMVQSIKALIITGIQSAIAVYFIPHSGTETIITSINSKKETLGDKAFIKAVIIGGLGYFPIYFFFGMLVSPFIIEYYNDPSLGLVIPPFSLIIPLEILRGFMFITSLLPIISNLRDRRNMFIACAAMLFFPGSLIPMIGNVGLPPQIIPYHTTELLLDSIAYSYLVARLFTPKQENR